MRRISSGLLTIIVKIGIKILPIIIKFAKVGKVSLVIGSFVAYSYLFTWQFALILMISLFVHEMGHVFMMKRCGMNIKGIYFIPFVGAAAVGSGEISSRKDEVKIAIMGPIWGLMLAVITMLIYGYTHNAFFGAVAGWMAMVNLFNLLPVNPLDGGRIMVAVAFSLNSVLGLIFMATSIIIFIILTIWSDIILFAVLLTVALVEFVYTYYKIKAIGLTELEMRSVFGEPMRTKNIIFSVALYILVGIILWIIISSMNNIPEVTIARSVFM